LKAKSDCHVGLYTIGVVVFIFDLALFITLCLLMATRLVIDPKRFFKSLIYPGEMFSLGAFFLSLATIIGCIQLYGIRGEAGTVGPAWPWLIDCIHILYWIYAGFAILDAILEYWIFMYRSHTRPVPITASWFLPGYSVMLTGTIAGFVSETQPPARRMPIIVSGVLLQGFGWTFSYLLIALYLIRLFESGPPPPSQRPGMFIPLCAPAYTMSALMGLSRTLPREYGYFAAHPSSVDTLQSVALFISIFLWLFGFWLFAIALLSCLVSIPHMGFSLTWWVFIFPNVGYTIATIDIGRALGSEAILWVASVMTVLLVAVWLFTAVSCVYAVVTKRIMWPGRDEDKDM
jgi:tellurite resistance protein TehA-like permease